MENDKVRRRQCLEVAKEIGKNLKLKLPIILPCTCKFNLYCKHHGKCKTQVDMFYMFTGSRLTGHQVDRLYLLLSQKQRDYQQQLMGTNFSYIHLSCCVARSKKFHILPGDFYASGIVSETNWPD